MGLRFRLKSDFDISGFSDPAKVILVALKKYGMILADNGSNWYISGAPDDRWNDNVLNELKSLHGSNFEAIKTVDEYGEPIYPPISGTGNDLLNKKNPKTVIFPNPFNASTTIMLHIEKSSFVKISVFNNLGKEIITLIQKQLHDGYHQIVFDGQNLPGGIYYYKISVDEQKEAGKLILLK